MCIPFQVTYTFKIIFLYFLNEKNHVISTLKNINKLELE